MGYLQWQTLPVSEGQSRVIVLGSEDLHPSTSHSNCKWSCTKDRNHTFTFIIIIIIYRCTSTIFEEVGIEIAMCCNIQQSTMDVSYEIWYDDIYILGCQQNGKCCLFSAVITTYSYIAVSTLLIRR